MLNHSLHLEKNNNAEVYVKVLMSNLALAFLKLALGAFGYSKLILMDGILAFSNVVVLLLMWQGDRLERKAPDDNHPYGYGKIVFIVATFSGFVVLIISIYMFFYSFYNMLWDEIHRSHSGAMMVTVISIFANKVLYRYMTDIGNQHSNNILLWNAKNNRINVFVSSIILICIILSSIGVTSAERIGVGIISFIIFCVSIRVLLKSFGGIMDKIPSKNVLKQIRSCAVGIKGVKFMSDLKARYIGSFLHVDLSILIDENLNMKEADIIARNVEMKIIDKIPLIKEVNAIIT